jgi:tRNA uridine 5-carboxymethylaminomethyl modification enzyme
LRRPEIAISDLVSLAPELAKCSEEVLGELETEIKYAGYIKRQQEQVERFRRLEDLAIPTGFNYQDVSSLSAEVREKLKLVAPQTLGQARRIPGVTPAAIAILAVLLRR